MDYPFKKLKDSFETLVEDTNKAHEEMMKHGTQYTRRVFVRTALASIENFIYVIKILTLQYSQITDANFSLSELALLKEESYELSNRGKAQVRPKFLRLLDNFRFAASCLTKTFGSDFKLDVEGEGWRCFRELVEIRHRITHPKPGRSLEITNEDMQICGKGMNWFWDNAKILFDIVIESGLLTPGFGKEPAPP